MAGDGSSSRLAVRAARASDLDAVAAMIEDFVEGHPAEHRARRPLDRLRAALFGDAPVARLLVATRGDRLVGMVQWSLVFDVFWSMYGGMPEWLYVRPDARGLGVAAMLIAEVCAEVRRAGGAFLRAAGSDAVAGLSERVAMASVATELHVSGEAFQTLADLSGVSARELVRRLPGCELNRAPTRRRS